MAADLSLAAKFQKSVTNRTSSVPRDLVESHTEGADSLNSTHFWLATYHSL